MVPIQVQIHIEEPMAWPGKFFWGRKLWNFLVTPCLLGMFFKLFKSKVCRSYSVRSEYKYEANIYLPKANKKPFIRSFRIEANQ